MAAPFTYCAACDERLETSEEQSEGIHFECDEEADEPRTPRRSLRARAASGAAAS